MSLNRTKVGASKKIHKKSKTITSNTTVPSKSTSRTTSTDDHKLSTFEEELTWCLAQLQLGAQTSSRVDKQQKKGYWYEKNYKTLSSTKTPLPRKRQLMRSLFGDYRSKMKSNPLVLSASSSVADVARTKKKSSRYFRHSVAKSHDDTDHHDDSSATVRSTFLFDFDITSDILDKV